MASQTYVIDILIQRLQVAWREINASPEDYAEALRVAKRRPIHPNTLRKLDNAGWSPSRQMLRDLEDVLLLRPVVPKGLKPRAVRRPRSRPPHSLPKSTTANTG